MLYEGDKVEHVNGSTAREVAKYTFRFHFPTEYNGPFVLRPKSASKKISDFIRECMLRGLMNNRSMPKGACIMLKESGLRGLRDILVMNPSHHTKLQPLHFNLLMRMRFAFNDGLRFACCKCGKDHPDIYHLSSCNANCARGYRIGIHQMMIHTLVNILKINPAWTVNLNCRTVVKDGDDQTRKEIVSDCDFKGAFHGTASFIQIDGSHVDVKCQSYSGVNDLMENNTFDFNVDVEKPLVKRAQHKLNNVYNPHHIECVPAVATSCGGIERSFLSFLYDVASHIANVQSPQIRSHDWIVPDDHILVGLLFQKLRARFAHAALSTYLHSLSYMVTSA